MSENIKKKKKTRFSGIDFLIVLIIILCLGSIAVRHGLIDKFRSGSNLVPAEISFSVKGVSPETADTVVSGGKLYLESGKTAGEIKSASKSSAMVLSEKSDGSLISVTDDTMRDIKGTLSASGTFTESGFMLNGNLYIAAGKTITLKTGNSEITVLITGVKETK